MVIVVALILAATTAARLPFFDHVTERFMLWKTASSIKMQLLVKPNPVSYHLITQLCLSYFFQGCFALLSRNVLSSN